MSNIDKMVDLLVEDEMNMIRSMSLDELDGLLYTLVREKYESMPENIIIEQYEKIGD